MSSGAVAIARVAARARHRGENRWIDTGWAAELSPAAPYRQAAIDSAPAMWVMVEKQRESGKGYGCHAFLLEGSSR